MDNINLDPKLLLKLEKQFITNIKKIKWTIVSIKNKKSRICSINWSKK